MSSDTVCRTIHQYNREPISDEDMKKLQEIAQDYRKVKDYVFARFGGIGSLSKLYPGYTVQNEMIETGLRDELGLPFVYFNLAVFDALGDIRGQWTRTKTAILERINHNETFSDEEKHYLRYLLKVNNVFDAVLNCRPVVLKPDMQEKFEKLEHGVDAKRLNNYLRRQSRLLHVKPHTGEASGFSLTERAYRYGDHGIYITVKEKRKRIFIPLTDGNQYDRQIYIKLKPDTGGLEIKVPVEVKIRRNREFSARVGAVMGMYTMLTTDAGHTYGGRLGEYQIELADWIRIQAMRHTADQGSMPGRKKYDAKKQRMTQRLHSYINMELNRFLREEKPETVYIPKLPKHRKRSGSKTINNSVNLWQRGYIRSRLEQKCREQSVRLVEVFGKNISSECSNCGASGYKKDGIFTCIACGCQTGEKINSAKNAKKRGEDTCSPDRKDQESRRLDK